MLQISRKQINSLVEARRREFVRNALPALYQEFPELWIRHTVPEIEGLLYAECERAASHSLNTAAGIYLLFTMRLRLGWAFPEGDPFAWAREILARDLIPEAERIASIEQVVWGDEEG